MKSPGENQRIPDEVLAELSLVVFDTENNLQVKMPQLLPTPLSKEVNESLKPFIDCVNKGQKVLGTPFGQSALKWVMDYGIQCGTFDGISFTRYPEYETDDHSTTTAQFKEIYPSLNILDRTRILEPSAGSGSLVQSISEWWRLCEICAIDSDARNVSAIINNSIGPITTIHSRFERVIPASTWQYDHVVMAPPTSRRDDLLHVMHAHKFLKAGGTMTAIVSACVQFRKDELTRDFEVFLARQKYDRIRKLKVQPFINPETGTGLKLVAVTYVKKS